METPETLKQIFHSTFSAPPIRGRGRTSAAGDLKRVTVELDPKLMNLSLAATENICATQCSMSEVVRRALEFYLKTFEFFSNSQTQTKGN